MNRSLASRPQLMDAIDSPGQLGLDEYVHCIYRLRVGNGYRWEMDLAMKLVAHLWRSFFHDATKSDAGLRWAVDLFISLLAAAHNVKFQIPNVYKMVLFLLQQLLSIVLSPDILASGTGDTRHGCATVWLRAQRAGRHVRLILHSTYIMYCVRSNSYEMLYVEGAREKIKLLHFLLFINLFFFKSGNVVWKCLAVLNAERAKIETLKVARLVV